jgi:protein SCO1/2
MGKQVKLGVLQGRIQVVAMFFASCEFACPITLYDLKSIEAALPEALRGRVEFLLVSFDTERDTVAALRDYRAKNRLDPARWTLLRGENDDVRELAALLGVNYRKDARGQFAHSNIVTVLNEQGEIVHQRPGLNHKPADVVQAIEKLVKSGPAKP